jgi:NAD(P)-dependent dehydrogenase (short-subunit alcohol dehydrogenase family)
LAKVVLITGASSGFGKLTAEKLLSTGEWTVYAVARRVENMRDLEQRGAHIIKMDVTSTEEVNAGVERIIKEQGRIDALLSNAGCAIYGMIECVPIEDIQYQYEVNLFGQARVLKAVLPHMRAQRSGRVVLTSSGLSSASMLGLGWYASTKHALKGMGTALRQELKDLGIDVVMVEPTIVRTEFNALGLETLRKIDHPIDYKDHVYNFEKWINKLDNTGAGPEVTADHMVKALTAKKPKQVYRTTMQGKLVSKLLPLMPDSLVDRFFLSDIRKAGKH